MTTLLAPLPHEPLDPKDYEIACLKLRNEQLRRRIEVLQEKIDALENEILEIGEHQ